MTRTLTRRAALLVLALLPALLAPAVVAQADDRSFARTAIEQAAQLNRAEIAASRALQRVDRRGRAAIPAARRAIRAVRRQTTLMTRAIEREQTSTQDGETAKRKLMELLAVEKSAYGTLDRALAAYKRGDMRTANALLARAKKQIRGVSAQAAELGRRLQLLAA